MTYKVVTEYGETGLLSAEVSRYAYDTERYMKAITFAPEVLQETLRFEPVEYKNKNVTYGTTVRLRSSCRNHARASFPWHAAPPPALQS